MFYGTYVGHDKMMITPKWGMRLYAPCDDMSLMPTLLVDGVIEAGLTNWIIKNANSFQGKTVIDVGANIGYFTVMLACIIGKGKVIAYEANPKIFDFLKENVYLGQLQDRVVLNNKAVSCYEGELAFHVSKRYQGNSSLKNHSPAYQEQFATDEFETIHVKAESLSNLSLSGQEIELVKIDVEGAEYDVFRSMNSLLKDMKVKHVVFELNKNMLASETDHFYDLLLSYKEQGALFYTFTPDGETVYAKLDDLFKNNYIDNILMKMF